MMPRRVLLTADTLGGVRDFALELARGLGEHGIAVALATLGGPLDRTQRRAALAVPGLRLYESDYRLEWMQAPWADVDSAGAWLQRLAGEWQPDVVHLNQYSFAALEWAAPVVLTAHSCVYSWFAAVRGLPPGPQWQRYWQAVRRGLAGADVVTAPTHAMLAAVQAHYGAAVGGRAGDAGGGAEGLWCGCGRARYCEGPAPGSIHAGHQAAAHPGLRAPVGSRQESTGIGALCAAAALAGAADRPEPRPRRPGPAT